jgi:hypothetical protein
VKASWISGAIALGALAAAGCAGSRQHAAAAAAAAVPREALPTTFDPLRWSVRPEQIPALFPNRETRSFGWRGREQHVVWSVADVRRVEGLPGTLQVDWVEGRELWMARLAFADPRRECDPDLGEVPLRCDVPGAALAAVFDALEGELAQGRGAPIEAPASAGGRSLSWRGIGFALRLSLARDERGAWSAETIATPLRDGDAEER